VKKIFLAFKVQTADIQSYDLPVARQNIPFLSLFFPQGIFCGVGMNAVRAKYPFCPVKKIFPPFMV